MRISTSQLYTDATRNMLEGQSKLAEIQGKIASGKNFTSLAEDPVGANQVVNLKRELAQFEVFQSNIDATRRRLELEETTLDQLNNAVTRSQELLIQASNGTLTDADRSSISYELEELIEYAANLMNTRDAKGEYIFSGSKGTTQTYIQNADGSYTYQGDDTPREIQVGSTQYLESTDTGQFLFEAVPGAMTLEVLGTASNPSLAGGFSNLEITDEVAFEQYMRTTGDLRIELNQGTTDLSGITTMYYSVTDSLGNPIANLADNSVADWVSYTGELSVDFAIPGATFSLQLPENAGISEPEVVVDGDGLLYFEADTLAAGNPRLTDSAAFTDLIAKYGQLRVDTSVSNTDTTPNVVVDLFAYDDATDSWINITSGPTAQQDAIDALTLLGPGLSGNPLNGGAQVADLSTTDLSEGGSPSFVDASFTITTGVVRDYATTPETFEINLNDGNGWITVTVDTNIIAPGLDQDGMAQVITDALAAAGVPAQATAEGSDPYTLRITSTLPGSDIKVDLQNISNNSMLGAGSEALLVDFGIAGTELGELSNNITFDVIYDGQTQPVVLNETSYVNAAALAAEISGQLTGISVTVVDGQLQFSEDVASNGTITLNNIDLGNSGITLSDLGLTDSFTSVSIAGWEVDLDTTENYSTSFTLNSEPAEELRLRFERPNTNILTALADAVEVMRNNSITDPESKTELFEALGASLTSLSVVQERFSQAVAGIGARINTMNSAEYSNLDFKLLTESTLSAVEDLDYASASTELAKRQLALEASFASFAKIQGLSLFNYIN